MSPHNIGALTKIGLTLDSQLLSSSQGALHRDEPANKNFYFRKKVPKLQAENNY